MTTIRNLTRSVITLNAYGLKPFDISEEFQEMLEEEFRSYIEPIQRLVTSGIIEIMSTPISEKPVLSLVDSSSDDIPNIAPITDINESSADVPSEDLPTEKTDPVPPEEAKPEEPKIAVPEVPKPTIQKRVVRVPKA